jgi:hypothetical protein
MKSAPLPDDLRQRVLGYEKIAPSPASSQA